MFTSKKIKNCSHYRSIDQHTTAPHKTNSSESCKDCVYFNNRNCGMDVADEKSPYTDLFC